MSTVTHVVVVVVAVKTKLLTYYGTQVYLTTSGASYCSISGKSTLFYFRQDTLVPIISYILQYEQYDTQVYLDTAGASYFSI